MYTIILDNIYSKITGDRLPNLVVDQLNSQLSYSLQNAYFIVKNMGTKSRGKYGPQRDWDGKVKLFWYGDKGGTFYTGMGSEVVKILKEHKISYNIEDHRTRPSQNCPEMVFKPLENAEDRPYQDWTVGICYKATRGIIEAATGSGKTYVVTQLISKIKTTPFLFVVLSTDLLDQAQEMLSGCLNVPIGKIGDGVADIQDISVITVQTAIKAIHLNDKKFKISDYKYDEEDKWDDDTIEKTNKGMEIQRLIGECKGIYFDECVSGDTEIITEKGKIKISKIIEKKCRFVLTHDGSNIVFKPILNFWKKGLRETIKIKTEFGNEITCTKEHPILTKNGWKKAGQILLTDEVFFVSAVVKNGCQLTNMADTENMCWDIKLNQETNKNGIKYIWSTSKTLQNVLVDAEQKCCQFTKHWNNLLNTREVEDIPNICKGMTNNPYGKNITLNQPLKKNNLYWGHVLEIPVLFCQDQDQKTTDYKLTMDIFKRSGLSIRQKYYQDMELQPGFVKTEDMEKNQYQCVQNAYHALPSCQNYYIRKNTKQLPTNYWTNWEMLDWHGGFVMMEALLENTQNTSHYIQKDGQKKKIQLCRCGLKKEDIIVKCVVLKEKEKSITTCSSQNNLPLKYAKRFHPLFQNVCNIKWQKIKSISNDKKQRVYDIEVKDTHCFFANNILVHNCHHASSKTCKEVLRFAKQAYWKYGGSATPYREDGEEMMMQALFGKKLVSISASYLIKHNFLVKPFIFDIHMNKDSAMDEFNSYSNIYTQSIVNNETLNKLVVELASNFEKNNITTLILVQQYAHGDNLKAIRPDIVFIKGNQPKKQRKQALKDLKDGTIKVAIATTLADEGLDIKRLGAVIVAGGGKSITRVYQRVGRTLRKFPGKDKAFVVLFRHRCKFLEKHGKRVYNLLKKEEEFSIKQSTPENIFKDIEATFQKK